MTPNEIRIKIKEILNYHQNTDKLRQAPWKSIAHWSGIIFHSLQNKQQIKVEIPSSVHFEIINRCNCKCVMCKQWSWHEQFNNFSKRSTYSILQGVRNITRQQLLGVTISGGDPFLHHKFKDIFSDLVNKGVNVGIVSDGLALRQDVLMVILNKSKWLRISMDGSTKEVYQSIRKVPEGFNTLLKLFSQIKKIREQNQNTKNCKIGINYLIQKNNYLDVKSMIGFANTLGIDKISFKFAHGTGKYLCTKDQIKYLINNIIGDSSLLEKKLTNLNELSHFISEYSRLQDLSNGYPIHSFYKQKEMICFVPYFFASIDENGDVYPCDYLAYDTRELEKYQKHRNRFLLGNLSEISLPKIKLSSRFIEVLEDINPIDTNKIPECGCCTRFCYFNALMNDLFLLYKEISNDPNSKKLWEMTVNEIENFAKNKLGIIENNGWL